MTSTLDDVKIYAGCVLENNKLKEENEKIKGEAKMFSETFKKEIKELKAENKKITALKQEEINEIVRSDEGTMKLYGDIVSLIEKVEKLEEENKKLKEDYEKNKQASAHLEEDGKVWDNAEEEWVDEEDYKYNNDDWSPGYGFTVKDGEYRITMAGGGSHWFDYVMTKNGCFIENKDEKKKVFTFVSCPEGNYIKVWDTPHMDGGLSLDEGETDMYEMVKECFQEEIMEYEEEEEEDFSGVNETCDKCGKKGLDGEEDRHFPENWDKSVERGTIWCSQCAEVKTKKKKKKEKKEKTKK